MRRLLATEVVERNILGALETAECVPFRLAVADVIDRGLRHNGRDQSLFSEMSGASGRFMPRTW